jgi:hypothetical protein
VFLSGGRLVCTRALQAYALVLLASCSSRQAPDASPAPDAVIGEATLLPPTAYSLALDSRLLGHILRVIRYSCTGRFQSLGVTCNHGTCDTERISS